MKYSIIEVFKKIWHFFRITGISGFWRKEEKQRFLYGIRLYKQKAFDWDLEERMEPVFFGEK